MKRFHHPAAWLTAVLLVAALYFAGRSWQAHRCDEAYQQRLKKSAPGPDQRPNEWFWLQRTFPYERYDLAVYQQALARVQQMSDCAKQRPLRNGSLSVRPMWAAGLWTLNTIL